MFCTKCGQELIKEAKFCTKCGAAVDVVNLSVSAKSQSVLRPEIKTWTDESIKKDLFPLRILSIIALVVYIIDSIAIIIRLHEVSLYWFYWYLITGKYTFFVYGLLLVQGVLASIKSIKFRKGAVFVLSIIVILFYLGFIVVRQIINKGIALVVLGERMPPTADKLLALLIELFEVSPLGVVLGILLCVCPPVLCALTVLWTIKRK
jgi:hypothetical protein